MMMMMMCLLVQLLESGTDITLPSQLSCPLELWPTIYYLQICICGRPQEQYP